MTILTNILVIKHGALGDIVLATAAFKAIRAKHPHAHIVLLTTKPYAEMLSQSPYFNEIWVDSKPRLTDYKALLRLRAMLNSKRWEWVYDLQTSTRTSMYQWLLKHPWPKISNANRFASHYRGKYDTARHALENIRAQMTIAGITDVGMPDVSWMDADISGILLNIETGVRSPLGEPQSGRGTLPVASEGGASPPSIALFVPGCSAHWPQKRWPAAQYASLAAELVGRGLTPVLIGTSAETDVLESIAARVPQAVNLCSRTSMVHIATLARRAALAVGNDTGPMHMIAASGCPALTLFGAASNPLRAAPQGPHATYLRVADLADLSVDRVLVALPAARLAP